MRPPWCLAPSASTLRASGALIFVALAAAASCRREGPEAPPPAPLHELAVTPQLAPAPLAPPSPGAEPPAEPSPAPAEAAAPTGCVEQSAQEFLMRRSYTPVASHAAEHERALAYRAERYGAPPGRPFEGLPAAGENAVATTFFGVSVNLNRKIVPVLRCVEEKIAAECGDGYKPHALSGIRYKNTFRGGEVSNHLFGIALDVDAMLNPCCNCVEPFRSNPRCKRKASAPEERMAMPYCWVRVFERYGFYWLGHDALADTMHFEFLGDPDRAGPPAAASAPGLPAPGRAGTPGG
ncbi:MAG TPA: M15 family metallopeptidase [Polyangiaceae bacterium]|nr:M15 family metallopeptidase [Polyangiaceae bacterium]